MKELSTSAIITYNRIIHAVLLAINDIMAFLVKKKRPRPDQHSAREDIHHYDENKASTEWTQMLEDELLISVLLDRLLYRYKGSKLASTIWVGK